MYRIRYREIRSLLKMLGINPYELFSLNRNRYSGWFPDLPERKPTVNVNKLSNIILEEGGNGNET